MADFEKILKLFRPQTNSSQKLSLGLDIGSYSAKAVVLSFNKNQPLFEEFAVEVLPEQGAAAETITSSINNVFKRIKNKTTNINVSLKTMDAVVRHIIFPKMTYAELKSALVYEIHKYIPFKTEEVIFDAAILSDLPDNKINVLLVAAKKDLINNFVNTLQWASITPKIIDVNAVSIANAFTRNFTQDLKGAAAIIDIGARGSTLNIIKDKILLFTRDIDIAGNKFTELIKEKFNLSLADAAGLKHNPKERQDELLDAILPSINNLAVELRSSFDYFEDQSGAAISDVFITGGSSALKGLDAALSKELELAVKVWDPLAGISTKPDISKDKLSQISGQLAVSVGLALRGCL